MLDALRGLALVWMTFFHLAFDLGAAGYIHQDFYADPVWTWQRNCILAVFLWCAGASQALALHRGQSWPAFWRRWWQIAGCALLVTVGSLLMFPQSFIYFGVLHGMAVMLVVARLIAVWGRWLWLAGALAIATKWIAACAISTWVGASFINEKAWNWLGLVSVKPITEDFVPLVPWLGVVWWGMACAQWWLARPAKQAVAKREGKRPASAAIPQAPALPSVLFPLATLGRYSLRYYMLHQPVLLGGVWLWGRFNGS